jgi:hypothetical protein
MRVVAVLLAVLGVSACQNAGPSNNAEAREIARQVYGYLESRCGLTTKPELLRQFDPIKSRLKTLENSKIKDDLRIAHDDLKYEHSTVTVECAEPDPPDVAEIIVKDVAELGASVARLEEIAGIKKEQAK